MADWVWVEVILAGMGGAGCRGWEVGCWGVWMWLLGGTGGWRVLGLWGLWLMWMVYVGAVLDLWSGLELVEGVVCVVGGDICEVWGR